MSQFPGASQTVKMKVHIHTFMSLKELWGKIKRPTHSSLAIIRINNWGIPFHTKDTHMGKMYLKCNSKILQEFEFFFFTCLET